MPMRHSADQAPPDRAPTPEPGQLCRGAGLINEDQSGRIKRSLYLPPGLACRFDVRPLLLGGVRRFF